MLARQQYRSMAKTRFSSSNAPLPIDNDFTSHSQDSDCDEDTSIVSYDDSFSDQASGCDESTLVIDLSTPTMMRTRQYDPDAIEGNFFLPQELNLVESSPQLSLKSPIDLSKKKSSGDIFSQAASLNDSAIFFHNGSPTTIAPADMHYALGSPSSPAPGFTPNMSYSFDLKLDNQGTLFQDFSPMKGDMSEFINFSPEKSIGNNLPRSLRKNKLSRVSLEASSKSPISRHSLVPNIFSTPKQHGSTKSEKESTPSPSRLPRSTKKDEDISLNMRKLRISPSPGPERSAKRIRSRSKSPVKQTQASATYPVLDRLCPDLVVAPRYSEINSRQGGRRRRETLEFRQFSKEMRNFSAINVEALSSTIILGSTGVEKVVEEQEEQISESDPKDSNENISQPLVLLAKNIRRKSMTAVVIPVHNEVETSENEQNKPDVDEEHRDISALKEKLCAMEAELSIVKAQLLTSQQAHEQSLDELKAERVARERAQDVVQFLTAETKFLLRDAYSPTATKATESHRSIQQENHDSHARHSYAEEDAISSTSGRSIRSAYTNDIKTRNPHPPPVTKPTRAGYAAPTKTREPYQRPNTTMGTYATVSRPASRTAFNSSTSSSTNKSTFQGGANKVLAASNVHNVVNQQPKTTASSLLSKKKSRANLAENVRPSIIKTQQTGGGAIRAVTRDRNVDDGLYGKR